MLLEEKISCFLEDPIIGKSRGFFRSLPLLSAYYNPIYTYHAKKWYSEYMQKHSDFDNFFNHRWVYFEDIEKPFLSNITDSFAIIVARKSLEALKSFYSNILDTIIKSALNNGFQKIILSIDNTAGLRINDKRIRTIDSIIPVTYYDVLYNNWLNIVDNFLVTIFCMSKSIILKSYGIYEQIRSLLNHSFVNENINDFNDMMNIDFPLIVMDVLLKILRGISEPDPSTRIKISDLNRYLTPWFENKKELMTLIRRCYEKIDDLSNINLKYRICLNNKIEYKLKDLCKNNKDMVTFNLIKGVVNSCAF